MTEVITISCPTCNTSFAVGSDAAGKQARCNRCNTKFAIVTSTASLKPTLQDDRSSVATTKKCPYCGEEILAIARRCKHCRANLISRPVKIICIVLLCAALTGFLLSKILSSQETKISLQERQNSQSAVAPHSAELKTSSEVQSAEKSMQQLRRSQFGTLAEYRDKPTGGNEFDSGFSSSEDDHRYRSLRISHLMPLASGNASMTANLVYGNWRVPDETVTEDACTLLESLGYTSAQANQFVTDLWNSAVEAVPYDADNLQKGGTIIRKVIRPDRINLIMSDRRSAKQGLSLSIALVNVINEQAEQRKRVTK